MKLLLLAAGFLLAVSATPIDEWNQYKARHNKVYTSQVEDDRRLEQYLKNKEMVEEHNRKYERGETTYTMGINKFSDWFPEEIDKMLGLKLDESTPEGEKFELSPGTQVPDSINWVEKGAVTSVKDQLSCGSCYAFSAAGALEGLMFTTNGTKTDLSAEQLVDCSSNLGCFGGKQDLCFAYVEAWGGIDTDESYPYIGWIQQCKASKGKIAMTCTGFKYVFGEEKLTQAVGTVGPVSISFDAKESFIHYKSGIYEDNTCRSRTTHGMLAVGYGKDNVTNKDYWLIKNSWSEKWGEKGYARVLRNVNMCGVGTCSTYPTYSK